MFEPTIGLTVLVATLYCINTQSIQRLRHVKPLCHLFAQEQHQRFKNEFFKTYKPGGIAQPVICISLNAYC